MRASIEPWRSSRTGQPTSRLKPVKIDLLTQVGLPSKGDRSLDDLTAQERYFDEISRRHYALVGWDASEKGNLDIQLSTLSISQREYKGRVTLTDTAFQEELATIFMAMRKLREAVVATARADEFAQSAYVFIVHAAVAARNAEAYHPAILYMLHRMHRLSPLEQARLDETVGLRILDLACRQSDFATAYATIHRHRHADKVVLRAVNGLVHGNWHEFWAAREDAGTYQKGLIQWADDSMRRRALNAIGKSYLSVDVSFMRKATAMPWEEAKQTFQLDFETEGDKIMIKRAKGR